MGNKNVKHLITLNDLTPVEINKIIKLAETIKKAPLKYKRALYGKKLLMVFEALSLRTRLSFEAAMVELHGHAINYNMENSPWGHGKETVGDVAEVIGRYCDAATLRIYSHEDLRQLAKHASIPIINAMTDLGHPCQVLGDLLTIKEKLKKHTGLKIAYLGDAKNNVTYSLMRACALTKNELVIACPQKEEYHPEKRILAEINDSVKGAKGMKCKTYQITHDAKKACKNADIIYADSWMSYRIPLEEKKKRISDLKPFQVTQKLLSLAKKKVYFMHCLPAMRGHEVTSEVIDGKRSIVFDQAENRLHIQKAIIMFLLQGSPK